KYATPRLTELVPDEGEIAIEDLIANEGGIITLTHNGLLKRTNVSSYRAQRRGGKGVIGMATREGATEEDKDFIEHLFTASTHDYLMFFTNMGRAYVERVHEIPDMGRAAAGVKGITLESSDRVVALAVVVPEAALLVAGENGIGKRTDFDEYLVQSESGARKQSRGGKGRITMKVTEKTGCVVGALTVRDTDEIMLITTGGQMVRTFVRDIREAGRNTQGVKLIELGENDKLQ